MLTNAASRRELERALLDAGFSHVRTKSSHTLWRHPPTGTHVWVTKMTNRTTSTCTALVLKVKKAIKAAQNGEAHVHAA